MVYGYIRVSTDKQTVENQRFEIERFCTTQEMHIDFWIEETVSGTIAVDKRALGKLLQQAGEGDLLICAELSRLGRSLFMILEVLNRCMKRGVRVWTLKDNYRLGDDIPSKVLAFAFGLSAEIERDLISQRTREALARCKKDGTHLGRPYGFSPQPRLARYRRRIQVLLTYGLSCREIAKRLNVHRATLTRFLRREIL